MKQIYILGILGIIIAVVVSVIISTSSESDYEPFPLDTPTVVQPPEGEEPSLDESESQAIEVNTWYQDYTETALQDALNRNETVVLFFHAAWCPTCRAFDTSALSYADAPLEALTLFKIDFDTATDLRRTYEVTRQHSFIVLDNEQKEKTRLEGVTTVRGLVERL